VRILVIARAVNRLGAFTLPFLAVVLTLELGASVAQAGLVMTLFGLATIPSRIFGGHLADRLGRKQAIILGLVGCAVSQAWIALADQLWSAVLAVALLGFVFEIYEPPSQAAIADLTAPADRPTAYAALGAAMAAAAVAAGLLAAALSRWDLRWLFVLDAATCLACAVLIGLALPATAPPVTAPPVTAPPASARPSAATRTGRPAGDPAGRREGWRDRRLLAMLAAGTVFATLYMVLILGLPLTLIARELPASTIGLVLGFSALTLVVAQPLQRLRRLRELNIFQVMTIGYLLLAAGLLANGFATNVPAFLAAAALWSLGDLLLLSRAFTIVAALAPDHARGRYLAIYGISWGIATTLAPLAATQLLDLAGPLLLWATCAAAALALAAVQPSLRRYLKLPGI
jgi:MFS family permease